MSVLRRLPWTLSHISGAVNVSPTLIGSTIDPKARITDNDFLNLLSMSNIINNGKYYQSVHQIVNILTVLCPQIFIFLKNPFGNQTNNLGCSFNSGENIFAHNPCDQNGKYKDTTNVEAKPKYSDFEIGVKAILSPVLVDQDSFSECRLDIFVHPHDRVQRNRLHNILNHVHFV